MTTFAYYPGCSLHGTAQEYDQSSRAVAAALELELVELEDWNCCGATSGHAIGGPLGLVLPARNLALAAQAGQDVVVPCAACFHALRRAQVAARSGEWPAELEPLAAPPEVHSLLGLLSAPSLLPRLKARVQRRLTELAVVPYYGCLLVRPGAVTGEVQVEDPQGLDRLLRTLGAQVRRWNGKTTCCGGSLTLSRGDLVARLSLGVIESARRSGGECIVTACPMCLANLEAAQFEGARAGQLTGPPVPVVYFTELLGLALGLPGVDGWLARHVLDPRPFLRSRGLR